MEVTINTGEIGVNGWFQSKPSDQIMVFEFNLKAKHAEVLCCMSDGYRVGVGLIVGDDTIGGEDNPTPTEVWFHSGEEWRVFSAEISRYTLRVCLVNDENAFSEDAQ